MTDKTKVEPSSSGLKRRVIKEDGSVKVVRTPSRMNLVKPRRLPTKNVDFANPATLIFPSDRLGLMKDLRKAVIGTSARIGESKETMKLFKDTVEILMKHVEARFEMNAARETVALKRRSAEDVLDAVETSEDDSGSDTPEEDETAAHQPVTVKKTASKTKKAKK